MFQQEYPEIKVEYSATPGRAMLPRIRQERELGKKLWDLNSGGIGTVVEMKKEGFFAPIRPLPLPDIADDRRWIGGMNSLFSDREEKYFLAYLLYIQPSVYVNRDLIREPDLMSSEQLLDPKFRGKIVILNPTGGSSRQSLYHLAFTYGEGFLRDLLTKQEIIVTDDNRQQVEWVVRGKYPIAIGFSVTLLIPFEKQGLGKNVMAVEDKIIRTTTGSGVICLFEGAPHPNAAKVYINWLLSQKTQEKLTKNIVHNSRRIDVPPVETAIDVTKFSKYHSQDTEEGVEFNVRYDPLIKEALKR
jgi:iron(III) transport system substrate-binding protein